MAGFSVSVQHRAVGQVSDGIAAGAGMFTRLLRRRLWWTGHLFSLAGFTFHALALTAGPLALVQPIAIMGMVFAPAIRAAMSREWLRSREAVPIVVTFAGLVALLVAAMPGDGEVTSGPEAWTLIGTLTALAAVLVLASRRLRDPRRRALLLGCASGLLFGMVAATLKIATDGYAREGLTGLVTTPAALGVVAFGIGGVALNQVAYRASRLSASMPALNLVNVLVASIFGYVVFDETLRLSPASVTVQVFAALGIAWGLWRLAVLEDHAEPAAGEVYARG